MIGIFKKKRKVNKIYSEDNAYFLEIEITNFYDYHKNKKISLSYQKAYQIGKELYEEKFGKLVGADLEKIKLNLLQVYSDKSLEEKKEEELEPSDIGTIITFLGKNAWILHHCWQYFKQSYREKFGIPEELISEDKLKKFFSEYTYEDQLQSKNLTKIDSLNEKKKKIRIYVDSLIKNVFDENTSEWREIDITHEFLQVRILMIDISNPIPSYIWNLVDGNPFYRVYRVCRDYMKWKNSLDIFRLVFDNVCRWESGSLFSGDEILAKYEEGLWVNWNRIGRDFISSKNAILELPGGLQWLKGEFSDYIKRRKNFYDKFTPDNNLVFSEEISKFLDDI
jgi:hypothetical protein